jgi:outer membrane protein assembly factor BamB
MLNLKIKKSGIAFLAGLMVCISLSSADDWPTHRHDNHRSGFTVEQLELPLTEAWVYSSNRAPKPAWDETPALQDFWQGTYGHKSRLPIENAFRVAVKDSYLYFGSSNSNKLTCLNLQSGSEVWRFFADGPIRFAPSAYEDKVYFGSDDGYVYCLNGSDGSFVWKYRATDSDELMYINGRMSSVCPVRTAVSVDNGVAYWGAGLFSGAQTGLARYVCACDAADGSLIWKISPGKATQGYPMVSDNYLYMPAGKSTPRYYNLSNGSYMGDFNTLSSRQGGAYALLSNDGKFYFGPHYSSTGSYIGKYNATTRSYESVAWGPGNHLVVTTDFSYYSTDTSIIKINRTNQQSVWNVASSYPYELILAGETLFAGGDDEVAALSTDDGSVLWTEEVDGRVRGLAVAGGKLIVSTDRGSIHVFGKHPADLDGNGSVGVEDVLILALEWLECTNPNDDSCHDETQSK